MPRVVRTESGTPPKQRSPLPLSGPVGVHPARNGATTVLQVVSTSWLIVRATVAMWSGPVSKEASLALLSMLSSGFLGRPVRASVHGDIALQVTCRAPTLGIWLAETRSRPQADQRVSTTTSKRARDNGGGAAEPSDGG